VLANITAVHRILFTRRMTAEKVVAGSRRRRAAPEALGVALGAAMALSAGVAAAAPAITPETERAWARAVEAYQHGFVTPLLQDLGVEAAYGSPIGDHARFLVADALERAGDLPGALAMALAVADRHPQSRLAPRALMLAARLAARVGDDAGAQVTLERLGRTYPDAREVAEALYVLGQTREALGEREAAAQAYRELRVLAPASGWAEGAEDRLAVLAAAGVRWAPLSPAQRLDRAERLLRAGVAAGAMHEAEALAHDAADPVLALRALRVMTESAQRMRRYELAVRALELALKRAPADHRPGLELQLGRTLVRTKQRERALTLFASVVAHGTEAEAAEAAYQRALLLDDMGRTADAAAAYRAVAARYPQREVAGAALWRLGWISYLEKNPAAAEEAWARISQIPGGRAHRVAALYWTGRAREAAAGPSAAESFYARVRAESPRSYYGALAARRGPAAGAPADVAAQADAPVRLPENPVDAVAADPGYARVALLRRVGLVEAAWEELEDVAQRAAGDAVRLYGLTSAYVKDERYHLALRLLRRHFAALVAAGNPLPQAFWEMLYPFGWRAEVFQAAERSGLDPYLVAAIVREESNYHPRAVSRAGARGLMQLMPATAEPMAATRGWRFRDGALLDEPAANISMGTAFLAGLMKAFGDPSLALAAYNAGPRRAREWWSARKSDDVEAWVEQIPFDETRHYVKRVLHSWHEYRRVYAGR
jgi:soluble lytic murein transglycosylase